MGRQSYENARKDLPTIEKQCETRRGHLLDTLRNIGPNWTEERLIGFDTSLAVQEQVSAHQRCLSESQSEHRDAARSLGTAIQFLEDSEIDLARAQEVLSAMPESDADNEAAILERRRLLRAMRSQLGEVDQHKARLTFLAERKLDLDAQTARLERDMARESFRIPDWTASLVLVLGLAGLLGLGIGRSDWLSGGIVFAISLAITVLLVFGLRKAAATAKRNRADRMQEIDTLRGRSLTLEDEAMERRFSLAHFDEELRKQAESVGLDGSPDLRAISAADGLVERDLEAQQRRNPVIQKYADAKATLAKAQQAITPATDLEAKKSVQLNTAQEQWRRWLAQAGLPETLTPENAANVLARLDAAREQLKAIRGDRERIKQITTAMQEYDQQVRLVATRSGLDGANWDDVGTAVDLLASRLGAHEETTRAMIEASRRWKKPRNRRRGQRIEHNPPNSGMESRWKKSSRVRNTG